MEQPVVLSKQLTLSSSHCPASVSSLCCALVSELPGELDVASTTFPEAQFFLYECCLILFFNLVYVLNQIQI